MAQDDSKRRSASMARAMKQLNAIEVYLSLIHI